MSKKPYTLRSLGKEEAAQVNGNFDKLFRSRIECVLGYDPTAAATKIKPFPVEETGRSGFSANGSPTIVKSFPLRSVMSEVLYAQASAYNQVGGASAAVMAYVTDVTASSITIEARTFSGGTTFSSVTTASFTVWWRVLGSLPS